MRTSMTAAAKIGAVVGACTIGLAVQHVYKDYRYTQERQAQAAKAAADAADNARWEREQLAAVETVADETLKDPGSSQYRNVKIL